MLRNFQRRDRLSDQKPTICDDLAQRLSHDGDLQNVNGLTKFILMADQTVTFEVLESTGRGNGKKAARVELI